MPYNPKIREDLVHRLYKLKHSSKPKKPITKLVNEAVEEYLAKKEVNHTRNTIQQKADGFTLDDKRNKTDKNDIPDILEKWKRPIPNPSQREGNKKIVVVDVKEIRENKYDLSISRYKPIEYEEVVYEKPDVIMEKVLKYESEIESEIKQIKKMIKDG